MRDSHRELTSGWPGHGTGIDAHDITVDGSRVRVVEAGPAHGDPVVLLHGWGASAYNFRGVIPELSHRGFHALAPDLPGHGHSESGTGPAWCSSRAYAEWVIRFLDAFALDRCVLVGQSIGGAIAFDTAMLRPDRVKVVIMLASIGFTDVSRVRLARALRFRWWHPSRAPRFLVAAILRRVYGTRGTWTQRDVDEYWWPLRQPHVVSCLVRILEEFDFEPRVPQHAPSGLRLVMRFGELDGLIPWRRALAHASRFPDADAAVMRGVGHVPADEVPDEVADLIATVATDMDRAAARAGGPGRGRRE